VGLRHRIDSDLTASASEPWAPRLWHKDPRFAEYIPKGDATVHDIAMVGTALDGVPCGSGWMTSEALWRLRLCYPSLRPYLST
jgi:hypothetical protein